MKSDLSDPSQTSYRFELGYRNDERIIRCLGAEYDNQCEVSFLEFWMGYSNRTFRKIYVNVINDLHLHYRDVRTRLIQNIQI